MIKLKAKKLMVEPEKRKKIKIQKIKKRF